MRVSAWAMGASCAAKLLIGADGADSKTRELLGIDTAGHAYHQDALVAHVRTAKPHRNTAWQRFLPTGPLAFLPLPDGRSSIVWSVGTRRGRAFAHARRRGIRRRARVRRAARRCGEVELTTPIASFPLRLQYAVDYVRPRAALLGDAAHAVHPLAGQGMNLGPLGLRGARRCAGRGRRSRPRRRVPAAAPLRALAQERESARRRRNGRIGASVFQHQPGGGAAAHRRTRRGRRAAVPQAPSSRSAPWGLIGDVPDAVSEGRSSLAAQMNRSATGRRSNAS